MLKAFTTISIVFTLLAAGFISPAVFARGEYHRFEYSEVAMGVRARVVVYARDENAAQKACRAAFKRVAQLEEVMSDYRAESELMRLCARAGGGPVGVSRDLLDILVRSEELSRRSCGAFDVTIGPVVKLWRKARKSGVLPGQDEIQAARRLVGWRKVIINRRASTVRLEMPGMLLA